MDPVLQLPLIAPLLILAVGCLAALMVGAFTNSARLTGWLAAAAIGAALVPWLVAPLTGPVFATPSGPLLQLSPFTMLASVLLLALALPGLPLFKSYLEARKAHKPEVYILALLSLTGMLVLINAADMLTLYMGLELMSFPLYILAAFLRNDARSSEAALKYFVLGALSSGLMLFGISLLYAATGTTGFAQLHLALTDSGVAAQPVILVGMLLTLTGLFFKLSLVPFHMWTPDVYEGAPTPVTAFMGSLPKIAAAVVLVRLLNLPFATLPEYWQPLLAVMALLSMGVGSALAILQGNLKRLLAWSTIANLGFVLVGAVAATPAGHSGLLFYLVVYGLTTLSLFAVLLATGVENTQDLKGLAARAPASAVAFGVSLFSLAGIPPLAGFMAKFTVFNAAVGAGFTWLALGGVILSVVAAFYSLWLVKLMAFDAPAPGPLLIPNRLLQTLALGLAGALLLLGLFPGLLTVLTLPAATALY